MFSRLRLLAVAGGLACAAVLGAGPQASAAVVWDKTMHTDDGDPGGLIRFAADGDYVEVCDVEADGYAVRGVVTFYPDHYTLTAGGKGKCSRTSARTAGHDLPEKICIAFRVALYKNGGADQYADSAAWYNGDPVLSCT